MDSLQKDMPSVRRAVAVAVTGVALLASGCATPPENDPAAMAAYKQANDPIEPFNRNMLKVNETLDDAVLKPISYVYKETLPKFAQDSVDSFLHNLRTPVILANDLMQGDGDRAWNTLVRFAANSTFGLGGLIDVAADMGYPKHDEDFGQTLAVWGIDDGPYLMLPLFGPSNPRDAVGRIVDTFLDPISYLAPTSWQYGQFAAEAVDERAKNYDVIEDLKKTSLDFYAAVRSLYRQRRSDEIRNGVPTANPSGSPSPMSGEPATPEDNQKASEPARTSMATPAPAEPPAPAAAMPAAEEAAPMAKAEPAMPAAEEAAPTSAPMSEAAPVSENPMTEAKAAAMTGAATPTPAQEAAKTEAAPMEEAPAGMAVAEPTPEHAAPTTEAAAAPANSDETATGEPTGDVAAAAARASQAAEAAKAAADAAMRLVAKDDAASPPEAPGIDPSEPASDYYAATRKLGTN